ncbi:hypothetical protein GUJ93_ZPchr0012g19152 [Zizania palustris]|uniref:O-fucosyltransferase family protein n=1 Tax=Zizania palustris TaxID=103762 RepID=A0A8J5WPN5_ZIZPA|nr:hypothetical protein GUJ93_ZPchr0012g19152 [Zizania palustris]
MRKKVDEHVCTLIKNGMRQRHRSMFVIVGDKSRDQIVNYMLAKSSVKFMVSLRRYGLQLLNSTLVIPEIQATTYTKGISETFKSFSYLYDVDHFISALSNDVAIIVGRLHASGHPYLAYHSGLLRDTLAFHGCTELFQDIHT